MDDFDSYYLSEVTGKKYPKYLYINHGWGGIKGVYKDLPLDEYPYTEINPKRNKIEITPNYDFKVIKETLRCPFKSTEKEDVFCVFYKIE